ncbi:MAG: hypothetical protein ACREJ5_22395 [Geminicoccaceae bacterium]
MTGRAARWTTAGLAMLCAGLGAAVAVELTGGLPIAPEVTAAPPTAPPLDWSRAPVAFEPPSRDELEVIAERPLFSPSRSPFVAAAEEPAVVPVRSLPPLQLIGVLLTEQQRTALVQAVGEGDPSWVREGHKVQGWRVEKIEESRVHLRAGDRLETVELRPDTAVPPKPRAKRRQAEAGEPEASDAEAERASSSDQAEADSSDEEEDSAD